MNQQSTQPYEGFIDTLCEEFEKYNYIDPAHYKKLGVKRGLRNGDGTGVMAGVTRVGNVVGYYVQNGERAPLDGQLIYRGVSVNQLVEGFIKEGRFGFEETAYLLLFGALPTGSQLTEFQGMLTRYRTLPHMFTEDMIVRAPSPDIMNKLGRAVLGLYSYDDRPEDNTLSHELHQAIGLIARMPIIIAHAYAVKRHYHDRDSLYLHRPQPHLSTAENFLYAIRPDNQFTQEEARLLDLCLVLHAEHGGGNNSAFACRVLSSSGTDIYAAISAAIGSLKGPRHGGANQKVKEMMDYLKEEIKCWSDEEQVAAALTKILKKEGGDGSGLIYGMGHAIYTLSDPRAVLLKKFAKDLAEQKGMMDELALLESIERLTPQVMFQVRGESKVVCANVDLYSGLVYHMLGIPEELFTPLFAMARTVGWCAHRIEEVYQKGNRIIRPAYKAVSPRQEFVPLNERG